MKSAQTPFGVPDIFHGGAGLCLIYAEHILPIPVKERRDAEIGYAVHVHRHVLQVGHDRAELVEALLGGVLEIDRDVDVRHPKPADARGLIQQCLLVCMEAKVDDVADTEGVDVGELRLGRLTGRGDPIIEPPPVVDCSGSSVSSPGLISREGEPGGELG